MNENWSIGPITVPNPIHWIGERVDGNDSMRDGGFDRPFDSYLPQPVQVAAVTIDGAIRKLVDKVWDDEGDTPDGAKITGNLDRSKEATRALQAEHAMLGRPDRFHSNDGWKVWATEAWPASQVLHGRVLQAEQSGDWSRVEGMFKDLEGYRQGDGFTGSIGFKAERFYDDNEWLGLAAMQAYEGTGDARYLEHAKRTFDMVKTGEHPKGGMYWLEQDRTGRHTCSVAPAAQLALRLHEATGDAKYLEFAKEQAAWLEANLRDTDGLYKDNVNDAGRVQDWKFTYNQGAPIGMNVQLYRATGDAKYLETAKATAKASIEYYSKDDRMWKEAPVFNAVFVRNLLALESVDPDPERLAFVDSYLDRLWKDGRDPGTGLFDGKGIGTYVQGERGSVIDQGAVAQMYAARALPPDKWAELT